MAVKANKPRNNTLKNGDTTRKRKNKAAGKPGLVQAIKSDRTRRSFGLFLLIFSAYLLIAYISYLFSWKLDDSLRLSLAEIFSEKTVEARNLGGRLGHALAYLSIKQGFGIAALLLPPLFFIYGVKISTGIRLLPLARTTWHTLAGLLWISFALAFLLSSGKYAILGGNTGTQMNTWFNSLLGIPGTALLLLFTLGTYLMTSWNISFRKWFARRNEAEPPPTLKEDKGQDANPQYHNPLMQEAEDSQEEAPTRSDQNANHPSRVIDLDVEEQATAAESPGNEDEIEMTIEETREEAKATEEPVALKEHYGLEDPFDPTLDLSTYQRPALELLSDYPAREGGVNEQELKANKERIVKTLQSYGIQIDKIKATIGPTITLYEIVPAPGIRISKIKNLADDIALSLSAIGIRIIAPLPGKGTIGIEVPNQKPEIVSIKSVLGSERFIQAKMELPIALGKTISNESYIADLTRMPHLLIAGATGQGKSVGLNAIIASLLYRKHPAELKFVMVDPKKVELTLFNKIERHFLAKLPDSDEAIITDTRSVVRTLNSLGIEMDRRYDLLNHAQVRNIKEYNQKFLGRTLSPNDGHRFLPYLVVIIDEFADLIMTAGKEVELPLTRLAQLARAIGIHLVIATQRPSTNIITGTIKANFPARIAFRVISQIDSRTILDSTGANHLIGRGDMLLSTGSDLIRLQCAFVDTPEVEKVTDFIGSQRGYPDAHHLPEYLDEQDEANKDLDPNDRDDMFDEAARVIVQHQHGSTSLLQRKLKLGYNRAGRIIDQLEAAGIVGPFEGSKAREVKIKDEATLEQYLKDLSERNLL
jgi:S-DNA-T family DNA segregation ATPase FtsK/SpoIIIE